MKIALAQTSPREGDIQSNISDHIHWISLAASAGAQMIVFPEMSLSGYERERAIDYSFSMNDPRLKPLQDIATQKEIIVFAGAAVKIDSVLYIGMFVFQPWVAQTVYTKQFLHTGEELFFKSSFDYNPMISLGHEKIALAICADIDHPIHPEHARRSGASMYVSGIFFSHQGVSTAHDLLRTYAKSFDMPAFMANYCGESYGILAGGRSAGWDQNGNLIAELSSEDPGLLILERQHGIWTGEVLQEK